MKKIVTLLLALSMIIAVSFTLSSCDVVSQYLPDTKEDVITVEDGYLVVNGVKTEYKVLVEEENPDNTEDEGNTENGNNNDNGDNTENGDNITEVRTTITAEEWEAIVNEVDNGKNYTVLQTITLKQLDPVTEEVMYGTETGEPLVRTDTFEGKLTEYARYYPAVLFDSYYAGFYVLKNNSWYLVVDAEEYYADFVMGENSPVPDYTGYIGLYQENYSHTGIIELSSFKYEDFVYDGEKGAYKFVQDESSCFMYFENAKLTKIEIFVKISYDNHIMYEEVVFSITDIGTTVIEIPEFTIVE